MATGEAEFTTAQTGFSPEQIELLEKLNCLEFETLQLNRAYQPWRSYVERGTAPDWMVTAIKITYDALISFWVDTVLTIPADVPQTFSPNHLVQLESAARQISGILGEEGTIAGTFPELTIEQTGLSTAQTELLEKLNCLEFETAQLNLAYQRWRTYLEQGMVPEWMAVAITITYHALNTFWLDTVLTILADVPHAFSARPLPQLQAATYEISSISEEESTTAEPSPEFLPMTEPHWSRPEMPAAFPLHSNGHTNGYPNAYTNGYPNAYTNGYTNGHGISEPPTFSARPLPQLEAAYEISGVWEEESTTEELPPELLPMMQAGWSAPEMPAAFSPPSIADTISEQPALPPGPQEEEVVGAEPANIQSLTTLAANWLPEGSSNGILFFVPPGTMGRIVRAACVAILVVAAGTFGIYKVSAWRAASRPGTRPVQNSVAQTAVGPVASATGEKAEFKFDPDPVVTALGRSFVLNAVLSRGSDISSMAVQVDYDANLLKFMGVSQGGFLVKDGRQVVLVQRNDPLTGVLSISAEKSPGTPDISGDGPVFALSFQARKKGKATVAIVPGAHDSLGRRIELAGSQVSVKVN